MYSLFRSLSDAEIFILIPLSACITLFIITLLLRNFRHFLFSDNYDSSVLDTATSNTMSGAYVVLGFVLVLAMSTLSELDSKISQEATAIRSLERLLVLEGSKESFISRTYLIKYVDSVLNEEWPLIKSNGANPKTAEAIKNFFTSLDNINPNVGKDTVVYSKILDRSDEVAKLRNARLFSVQNDLPAAFYFVSLFSILGVLLICSLRLVEATAMRVFALTTQIVMLTIMFSAVLVIDLPFLGDTVISPEPIVLIHENMKIRVGLDKE